MRRALVTGATKGIGFAIAAKLVEKGFFVYVNYAHDDSAAGNLDLEPTRHCVVKADLSSPLGVDLLADQLLRQDGMRLDYLVLNAGATCRKPFDEMEYEDWFRVMNTNVNMPFFLVQKLLPVMVEEGAILFVGSDMGIYPHAASVAYSVSKAAVHMLARSLVKEVAARGIRVNAIAPGFVDTEWQREKPVWLRQKIEGKVALKRFGRPDEIADACLNLLENGYINGAVLQVDGGYDME